MGDREDCRHCDKLSDKVDELTLQIDVLRGKLAVSDGFWRDWKAEAETCRWALESIMRGGDKGTFEYRTAEAALTQKPQVERLSVTTCEHKDSREVFVDWDPTLNRQCTSCLLIFSQKRKCVN